MGTTKALFPMGQCRKRGNMLFDIKLDTTSEYMMDVNKWPKAICNVMVESDKLIDAAKLIFDKEDGDGYVDIYAMIEPERRLVTEFLVIFKDLGGSQDDITIKVSDIADSVEYYMQLEEQGGGEFIKFITSACWEINSQRMAASSNMVEVVEDFLEDRDIRIPSSDKEMVAAGDSPKNNSSRIYGADYSELVEGFEDVQGISPQRTQIDRLKALSAWCEKYLPDEDDFYSILFDAGFTGRQIEDACGEDAAVAAKTYWEEHGYI
jgi:hypothetical protein